MLLLEQKSVMGSNSLELMVKNDSQDTIILLPSYEGAASS